MKTKNELGQYTLLIDKQQVNYLMSLLGSVDIHDVSFDVSGYMAHAKIVAQLEEIEEGSNES